MKGEESQITQMLVAARNGDQRAIDVLFPAVYDELRALASGYLAHERAGHTLQATALVNEAYVKLVDQEKADWQSRTQFFRVAAKSIRRILVDHARGRNRVKRRSQLTDVCLHNSAILSPEPDVDYVELDEALTRFAEIDPQGAQVVELRFFGGLTMPAVAESMEVPLRTVERDWHDAKLWLQRELSQGDVNATDE